MKLGPSLEHIDFETLVAQLDLPPRDASTNETWSRAQAKVEADMVSSKRSGAPVSPTFLINSRRYEEPWDENTLAESLRRHFHMPRTSRLRRLGCSLRPFLRARQESFYSGSKTNE